jgi:hypothetical protein
MTTPYEEEYGDFKAGIGINSVEDGNFNIQGSDSLLKLHHQAEYAAIDKLKGLEWDDEYKRLSIENIKQHPVKYAKNIFYNMGRLVFHYPFSQAIQRPKTLFIFPVNGILFTLMLFSLIPTVMNWRKIPIYLQYMLIVLLLYLGASSLITAYVRMFSIVVPIILVWIAYMAYRTLNVNLKFTNTPLKDNPD